MTAGQVSAAIVVTATIVVLSVAPAASLAKPDPRAGAAPPASAGASTPPARFLPFSDYELIVDGRHVEAAIYLGESTASVLVVSDALPSPVLLAAGSAAAVAGTDIEHPAPGALALRSGAKAATLGSFELVGEDVRFVDQGRQVALHPLPPLLGLRKADEVTRHNPEYELGAAAYRPDSGVIGRLRKEPRAVRVRVYYGSWCPHCRQLVPHALTVERALEGTTIHFEYFGVDKNAGIDPALQKIGISSIPMGIVFVDGAEVGRIARKDWNTAEKALLNLLNEHRAAGGSGGTGGR